MKQVMTSVSVEQSGMNRLAPNHLWELAARLFRFRADRWRRRALFYKKYQDYFPHVATSRFVERCLELDLRYRGLAEILRIMQTNGRLVTARSMAVGRKRGRMTVLPRHPVIA